MPCPLARPASVTAPTSGSRGLASGSHQRPPPSRAGHPAHSCGARVVATSQRPQEAQAWGPEWWTRGAVGVRGGRLAPTACARRAGGGSQEPAGGSQSCSPVVPSARAPQGLALHLALGRDPNPGRRESLGMHWPLVLLSIQRPAPHPAGPGGERGAVHTGLRSPERAAHQVPASLLTLRSDMLVTLVSPQPRARGPAWAVGEACSGVSPTPPAGALAPPAPSTPLLGLPAPICSALPAPVQLPTASPPRRQPVPHAPSHWRLVPSHLPSLSPCPHSRHRPCHRDPEGGFVPPQAACCPRLGAALRVSSHLASACRPASVHPPAQSRLSVLPPPPPSVAVRPHVPVDQLDSSASLGQALCPRVTFPGTDPVFGDHIDT